MALGITANGIEFTDAVTDLRAAADRLRDDRDRAARSVDGLLSGWTGTAADSYDAGWAAWCDGAGRVLDGLATMADLVQSVAADLSRTDDSSAADLARLTSRLG
ncbi:WXG100 family type VII secretion target [Nocardioides mangrovi]|uniref:WXG100 family type VII secretion target n=1 Tax=Nocardioides mangrovi TaxID=2874580 RepID=A0ABS7U9H9_9ACTN|nr:WXG100 family type VII secretion target [Nocardioides mangrovi]MBZ5737636.1 WXG100 family type VII secretion target [Nocardioides mangrovi]